LPAQEITTGRWRCIILTNPATPENDLTVDLAQVSGGANLKSGIPRLQQDLEKYRPTEPVLYLALGNAYKKVGKYDQAIHWYEQVLRSHADFRPALEELGDALIAAGRRQQATEVLEKAVAQTLPNTGVLTNLGGAHLLSEISIERVKYCSTPSR
jgi:tetratricopeptide (TPR) repeat protein